jgi:F0F1-type ATP synthase alpha subunit
LAATEGYLDAVALKDVPIFEGELLARFEAEHPGCHYELNRSGELTAETREALVETMAKGPQERMAGE